MGFQIKLLDGFKHIMTFIFNETSSQLQIMSRKWMPNATVISQTCHTIIQ